MWVAAAALLLGGVQRWGAGRGQRARDDPERAPGTARGQGPGAGRGRTPPPPADAQVADGAPRAGDAAFDAFDTTQPGDGVVVPPPDGDAATPGVPQSIVVTEILYDPTAMPDTEGEWVELLHLGDAPLDAAGIAAVTLVTPGGTGALTPVDPGQVWQPGQWLVVVRSASALGTARGTVPMAIDAQLGLANQGGVIQVVHHGTVVDTVQYGGASGIDAGPGVAVGVDPDWADPEGNDDPAHWCGANGPFATGDWGTPGAPNPPCGAAPDADAAQPPETAADAGGGDTGPDASPPPDAVDASAPDVPPPPPAIAPGAIVVTEIHYDPVAVSDTAGEWFEIYGAASEAVLLDGLVIEDGATSHVVTPPHPLWLHPGQYLVLGRNADPLVNGGVDVAYAFAGITLNNDGDVIRLRSGDIVVDEVTYPGGGGGAAWQLDPNVPTTAEANDDPDAWCLATEPFGDGDKGTPGAPNTPCPAGPQGECAGLCGDQAPSGCWCDELCVTAGDCCPDACASCGYCP